MACKSFAEDWIQNYSLFLRCGSASFSVFLSRALFLPFFLKHVANHTTQTSTFFLIYWMVSSKYTQLFKSVFQQKLCFLHNLFDEDGRKTLCRNHCPIQMIEWSKKISLVDGCPRSRCEAWEMIFNQFTLLLFLHRWLWSVLFISIYWLFESNREWKDFNLSKQIHFTLDTSTHTHAHNIFRVKKIVII